MRHEIAHLVMRRICMPLQCFTDLAHCSRNQLRSCCAAHPHRSVAAEGLFLDVEDLTHAWPQFLQAFQSATTFDVLLASSWAAKPQLVRRQWTGCATTRLTKAMVQDRAVRWKTAFVL